MNHYQYLYQHYHAISFHNYQSKYFTKFSINYVFLHLVHATIFYLINISMKQAHIYYLVKIYKPTCLQSYVGICNTIHQHYKWWSLRTRLKRCLCHLPSETLRHVTSMVALPATCTANPAPQCHSLYWSVTASSWGWQLRTAGLLPPACHTPASMDRSCSLRLEKTVLHNTTIYTIQNIFSPQLKKKLKNLKSYKKL